MWNEYLEKGLSKEQIAELKQKAHREAEILRSSQNDSRHFATLRDILAENRLCLANMQGTYE